VLPFVTAINFIKSFHSCEKTYPTVLGKVSCPIDGIFTLYPLKIYAIVDSLIIG
jgi:hypothetical protein